MPNFWPRCSLNLLICHVPTVPSSLPYFPYIRTHTTFLHYLPVPFHYRPPLFLSPGAHCSDLAAGTYHVDLATGAAQLVNSLSTVHFHDICSQSTYPRDLKLSLCLPYTPDHYFSYLHSPQWPVTAAIAENRHPPSQPPRICGVTGDKKCQNCHCSCH